MAAGIKVMDGRRARGERARQAVAEALLALFAEGDLDPPAPRIAARAGVSQRLLYHHFADLESLFDEVARRQLERLSDHIRPIPRDLSMDERLAALLQQRGRLYELITPVRRAALLHEGSSPSVAMRLQTFRALKRAQVEEVFAHEIAAHPPGEQPTLRAALGAATSWSSWEALRAQQGLSAEQAAQALALTVRSLLRC